METSLRLTIYFELNVIDQEIKKKYVMQKSSCYCCIFCFLCQNLQFLYFPNVAKNVKLCNYSA